MAYIVTQQDIDIIRQSNRELYTKVELLNHNFKVIDALEGNLISDSYSISAESNIRRTYNCELHISDSSFLVGEDKKIWIDRYIRPYIGIARQRTGEIVWYRIGTFVLNDTEYRYDATSRTLSLSCSDLMCALNGDRGGYIEGLNVVISEGSYIRDVIVALLNDAGITRYRVEDVGRKIPYDIENSVGSTYYDVLKKIVDLYAGYEMFFDVDGTFIIQAIPTGKNEVSVLDESIINPLVITEPVGKSFNKIYNVTQVWGAVIDTDHYVPTSASTNGIAYTATFESVTQLENFAKYGVRITKANGKNPTLNINGLGTKPIVEDNGLPIEIGRLVPSTDYVFKYRKATEDLLLLGQYQAYGEYKCEDTDCPFSTTNLGYEIKQVLQFDELISDSLCQQRAKYETWLSTRMQDTLNLTMMAVPFLDVNWKVSYQSNNTGNISDYIIKSISGSNSESTMSVNLIAYSELYPDII